MLGAKILGAGAVLVASMGALQAQSCSNPMDQSTMTRCAYEDWQAADVALNAMWKRAMAAARGMDAYTPAGEATTSASLLAAQRTWITFRDQACLAESLLMRGGSAQPMLEYGCKARLTRARTEDLRNFADML
ncbi:MAG TPA: DUF1311 domain-containing protein [Aliiroseovarius sp.]|nr:DUF1311 domain-containing protein [Aliiroseovarius sp.]